MKNKKLIIFDMDGVLVDLKELHFQALNNALADIDNRYVISYNDHLHKFDGLKTIDKLKILTQEKNLCPTLYEKIWRHKQNKTIEYIKLIKTNQNIISVLDALKKYNFIVAVASNSIRSTVKEVLLHTGYYKYIDFFYSNEDVFNSKPSTEIYLRCMIKANVSPKETIIIEDSPVGIKSANLTGAHVLPVKNSEDINNELLNNIKNLDNQSNIMNKWKNDKLNIVIPMAGAGSRFQKAGYAFPKPLIEVNNQPMIKMVVDNLNIEANYIFIVQKAHLEQYNLNYLLNMIAPNCSIVPIDGITEGAACTVLMTKKLIDNDNPLIIANSDQYIEWNSHDFMYEVENSKSDGYILTFESMHPKWSYIKVDPKNYVTEVAEKKPISNIATVGIYYWKHGKDFVKYAEQMISKNIRVNNEFYVCPVYNEAILDNKKIQKFDIDKMWGIGTPEDLDYFVNNYKESH